LEGKSFDEFSVENGINIIRVKTFPHHKVNFIIRGISQLTMPYIFLSKIKRYLRNKIDIVIIYSPPLPLAMVGKMIKKKHGSKIILNIQDIFPQNAVDLGILKNHLIINFFEIIEKKAYEIADKIVVHSNGNREFLVNLKHVPDDKVHVLHNWIDTSPYINANGTGSFRRKYGLNGKFVILFAGIIGPSQGLDVIIKAANKLRGISDICFLFVGDGTEKNKLIRMAEKHALKNVVFKSFVSNEEYPNLLKEVDVGMVCLSSNNKTPVIPGKILGYMASSIPVVAFLNRESDMHLLIKEAECGYSAISDDYKKVADVIIKIHNEKDKLKQYGENGFKYASTHFEKSVCINTLEKLF
jgi:glycosyltransferase involved in cell wall biosynthesis